jgi:cytochrome b pre-mRNA-processing protein 3
MVIQQPPTPESPRASWLDRCWPERVRRRARRRWAHDLYGDLVDRARQPVFYRELGVPDTPEGRFEMVGLHAALVMRRLQAAGEEGRGRGQELFDVMFADMDAGLRELGIGDLSVGKHVKRLARNFHARLATLDATLSSGDGAGLRTMLASNVYHGGPPPRAPQLDALVGYLKVLDGALCDHDAADLLEGRLAMPAAPTDRPEARVSGPPGPLAAPAAESHDVA